MIEVHKFWIDGSRHTIRIEIYELSLNQTGNNLNLCLETNLDQLLIDRLIPLTQKIFPL